MNFNTRTNYFFSYFVYIHLRDLCVSVTEQLPQIKFIVFIVKDWSRHGRHLPPVQPSRIFSSRHLVALWSDSPHEHIIVSPLEKVNSRMALSQVARKAASRPREIAWL